MARVPVYFVPAPIGESLSDMAVASMRRLAQVRQVFVESEGRLVQRLKERGVLTGRQALHVIGEESPALASRLVREGEPFALLADTGAPCFVDPGHAIVRRLLDEHLEEVELIALGMSTALDAALVLSGLDIQRFAFVGHHPENVDYAMAEGHRHPVVLYVLGAAAGRWARALDAHLPGWTRATLFSDLRKRRGQRITILRPGDAVPEHVRDDPSANYAAVVER